MSDTRGTKPRSLVERLRSYIPVEGQGGISVRDALMHEAADEIARQRKEISRLENIVDAHEQAAVDRGWPHD